EQRQNRRVWSDRWREGCNSAVEIERLTAQQNDVEWSVRAVRQHGRRGQIDVAEPTAYRKTRAGKLRGTPWPHQECHVTPCFKQASTEIAANRAGANNQYAHRPSPFAVR